MSSEFKGSLFFAVQFVHQITNSNNEMQDNDGDNDNGCGAHNFFYP